MEASSTDKAGLSTLDKLLEWKSSKLKKWACWTDHEPVQPGLAHPSKPRYTSAGRSPQSPYWTSLCFFLYAQCSPWVRQQPSTGTSMQRWVEALEITVLPQTRAARLGASLLCSLSMLVWEKEKNHPCLGVPLTCNAKYLQIRLHTAQGQ